MQMKYTEEKRNTFSKETLIQLFLTQQEQLSEIDGKLQLVLEQLAVMNQNRFGRKTEQMPVPEQLAFTDVDGELVLFNEAEVLAALDEREKETTVKKRLEAYHSQTAPLIAYYKAEGVYREIDGTQPIDKVYADVVAAVKG